MVRASAHGAMGRRIDPSWGGPIDNLIDNLKITDNKLVTINIFLNKFY